MLGFDLKHLVFCMFLRALAVFSMIALLHAVQPAQAQDTAGPAATEETAAAEEEAGPDLSAALLDSGIDVSELELRLIPLTKTELEALSAQWLDIVRKKTEDVMTAQIDVNRAGDAVTDAARNRVAELTEERGQLFDKYSRVISALEKKGGDPALVEEYRAYRSAVIVEEKRTADFQTLLASALRWMTNPEGGIQVAINIGIIVAAIFGLLIVARIIRGFANRWIRRVPNLSKLLQAFLVTLVYWLVLAIGLMVVLSSLGIDISPVFALIGGASFIMAFAFQDTLGNLASGLMIMINRPFDEGDYVDVGGVGGTVRSVSIVATTVVTPDNQTIVIPNKNVWGNVITNVTSSPTRRVDLVFGISYEDSIPEALRVIEETVQAHPLILEQPAPVIKVNELADSSVNFICRPWTKTSDYWDVYWDLTQQVKENFDAAGISIPYPQQDLHIRSDAEMNRIAAITS